MGSKILIVEDEQDILELISAILSDIDDLEIFHARDGEKALSIACVENPDVILLDIHLPKLDGWDVCKIIKADASMKHTKVVMLSVVNQNYGSRKANEVGADGYISKPFNLTTLLEKVNALLGIE